jgi:hypothetical protein
MYTCIYIHINYSAPVAKAIVLAMAFGDVEIGRMKAKEQASVTPTIFTCFTGTPVAKAMAFGGVEIGRMKAKEQASVTPIICAVGDTFRLVAISLTLKLINKLIHIHLSRRA